MKSIKQKKGFTLVELLVASTIFAIVMMLALATFAWAANYNTKLKQIRYVTGDGKRIISEISKDIRLANGSANFGSSDNLGEVTLVKCDTVSATSKVNCVKMAYNIIDIPADELGDTPDHQTCGTDPGDPTANPCWNGIMLFNRDRNELIIYYSAKESSVSTNYLTKKRVLSVNPFVPTAANITGIPSSDFMTMNDENKTSVKVDFYGKLAEKNGRKFQPYLRVEVNSRTKNSVDIEAKSKFEFQFETLIETRDYSTI